MENREKILWEDMKNLDLETMAKEIVQKFCERVTHPHILSLYHVITVMADGKERTWSELQKEVPVSPRTLTSVLKALVEAGYVERRIIPAFPPKSSYILKDELLKKVGLYLKKFQEVIAINFLKNILLSKEMPTPEYTDSCLRFLNINILEMLEFALLSWPPREEEPSSAYILACCLIGAIQNIIATLLALSKGQNKAPKDIVNELGIIIEEKRKELKELEQKLKIQILCEKP